MVLGDWGGSGECGGGGEGWGLGGMGICFAGLL